MEVISAHDDISATETCYMSSFSHSCLSVVWYSAIRPDTNKRSAHVYIRLTLAIFTISSNEADLRQGSLYCTVFQPCFMSPSSTQLTHLTSGDDQQQRQDSNSLATTSATLPPSANAAGSHRLEAHSQPQEQDQKE